MSKKFRGLTRINGIWHIDKQVKGYGRLCESCETNDEDEAGALLGARLKEIRDARVHGVRPKRTFREAATRYLNERAHKRAISRDRDALVDMDEALGEPSVNIMDLYIDQIHDGSFEAYRNARRNPTKPRPGRKKVKPLTNGTLNRNIAVAHRVLQDAATKWRHEGSNLTWLAQLPWINTALPHTARKPYPLDWDEQRLFFSELAAHLEILAQFGVNAGPRDDEICQLEWAWERRIPELDTADLKRTVFIIPGEVAKNKTETPRDRILVLNDAAQRIVDSQRGLHPRYVFTYVNREGERDRLYTVRNSGWLGARRRAAKRYEQELGRPCPAGFRSLRFHDTRHTYGRRLRAAKVSFEDRQDLLGHHGGRVTTEYSAPEIGNLIEAANEVIRSRETQRTVLRVIGS